MKERLSRLSDRDRAIESRIICKELKKLLGATPKTVTGYIPLPEEPNIRLLLEELLKDGWKVALPLIDDNALGFRFVENLSETMKNPQTNLYEPPKSNDTPDPVSLNFAIVPGKAFTKIGDRMGRGNGGYDIWIRKQRALNPNTTYIGVCFECQVLPALVMEEHDEKVDAVVTARGMLRQ